MYRNARAGEPELFVKFSSGIMGRPKAPHAGDGRGAQDASRRLTRGYCAAGRSGISTACGGCLGMNSMASS
jgi:hypothetical protein